MKLLKNSFIVNPNSPSKALLCSLLLVIGLGMFNSQAFAQECASPTAPIIPDGNVASEDELVGAQTALKTFQGDLIEYRKCLAQKQQAMEATTGEDADGAQSAAVLAEEEALLKLYNDSVTAEENAADEFNKSVRAYKARQN